MSASKTSEENEQESPQFSENRISSRRGGISMPFGFCEPVRPAA